MTVTFFRAPSGRIEHIVAAGGVTLCGRDARCGAKYTHADNHADSIVRPLCAKCRRVHLDSLPPSTEGRVLRIAAPGLFRVSGRVLRTTSPDGPI